VATFARSFEGFPKPGEINNLAAEEADKAKGYAKRVQYRGSRLFI
jgi:hypothetical protein